MSYEVVDSNLSYSGKILKVYTDTINLPDGNTTKRETVVKNDAAAVVAVDEKGRLIFVRQYRHATKSMMLEIPAGTFEKGEDPYDCAMRELEEETGYKAESLRLINASYAAIGMCSEQIYIYIADGLTKGVQNLDEDEFVEIEYYSLEDAMQMIIDGRIADSKTVIGILAYKMGLVGTAK